MSNEKTQTGTVDRFEGGFAIIELPDKRLITVNRNSLDLNISEGDRVISDAQGNWRRDEEATDDTRKRIRTLMDDLFE